ncbi:MAG: hypothetical protein JEY97_04155 [Bacteroidales bacterium]|nr:hypothetical protein [Bacteroidales bacterium]
MKYIVKLLGKILLYFIFIILLIVLFEYIFCPVYNFPEPEEFSGKLIYNPYQDIDSTKWQKGNFQIQSQAWAGITDGRNNSSEAIFEKYTKLGYDVIVISDYQKINKYNEYKPNYIPTYEHGYGINKNHQVCIGSDRVMWTDYPFGQNLSQKQHIINLLRDENEIVAIAHPDLRGGFSPDDMKYLSNYDLLEALNEARFSIEHWDAALSSGHPAFILADDDGHNLDDSTEIGRICTFINAKTSNRNDIIASLKNGKVFGADLIMAEGETFEQKIEKTKHIPNLTSVQIVNDTLFVSVDSTALNFRFIGQNAEIMKIVNNTKKAFYPIKKEDTYIRTEIIFADRSTFYLNPVFRFDGKKPYNYLKAEINWTKTWILRFVSLIIIVFVIVNIIYLKKKRKKKRSSKKYF